ncbi:helicase HerA-like domain-containing protein [Peptoniphilus lacrimalis]|uniref:Ornithine/acetylornithine aminotransferase n=1 Tax=Peptoniphilus lacrimalis TaxID=33031 RepID=A0A379C762_9FIRM|nr:helicase HerA-like domain-containing protein [Peptoniphilus lacrimalis]SUB57928.1 Ornithine/acetylornithine aminotransferase [Peptoniphilus lacrimalis]
MAELYIGKGKDKFTISSDKLNQHGIIAGATGSGKTVTVKVLIEELSKIGVPTFVSDVKGDLTNLCKEGRENENIKKRLIAIGQENFEYSSYPVNLWDIYQENGINLRISISELGPLLLSQILELNEVQEGVLNILFKLADENGLLLLDFKDLNSMLGFLTENAKDISAKYGNISSASISAIRRKLLVLEEEGADNFFGEPSIDVMDFLQKDSRGYGFVNILNSKKLINSPKLYSIFLIYLFTELFQILDEVGNPEIPKAVFFFDEAHLLFDDISKVLLEKLTKVVKLIRSKGVGIFFISQNPLDIDQAVSSQLSTKIIHQLRAFSPKELKNLKEISLSLRENKDFNTMDTLTSLGTGVAIISSLDENGIPKPVEEVIIRPLHSSFDVLTEGEIDSLLENSNLYRKYQETIDRTSAYEILQEKLLKKEDEEKKLKAKSEEEKNRQIEMRYINKGIDSMLGTITRTIGREIARGILGSLRKK